MSVKPDRRPDLPGLRRPHEHDRSSVVGHRQNDDAPGHQAQGVLDLGGALHMGLPVLDDGGVLLCRISASMAMPNGKNPLLGQLVWRDQVVIGYSMAQLMLFILAMIIGIGTIANDNRANALLIYLSKPCTKLDYLIGKWVGIFIPLYCVTLVPGLIFWAYIAMSFREYGSISSAPWIPLQLVVVSAFPACLLASVCVGISSLFKDGRLAGATFAGVYVVTNIFTQMMQGIYQPHVPASDLVRNLYYASVDGISIGIGKLICVTDGSAMFGQRGQRGVTIGAPNELLAFVVFFGISVFCVLIAWLRIRPVEVVG